ncbi:hypothetical protein GQ600_20452 [Phytophthora cactorum]|nr:hypothetical protein GQ600_20452 [Phytophthora cactorum]
MLGSTHSWGTENHDAGSYLAIIQQSLESLGDALRDMLLQIQHLASSTVSKTCGANFAAWLNWSSWVSRVGGSANKELGCAAAYCWKYGWIKMHQGNTFEIFRLKLGNHPMVSPPVRRS